MPEPTYEAQTDLLKCTEDRATSSGLCSSVWSQMVLQPVLVLLLLSMFTLLQLLCSDSML
mgnify:CR=1 FL=1